MRIWNGTEQLLYDASREQELMDILGIESMDEVTIIPWRSPDTPPENARYVLLKFYDPVMNEVAFDFFAYENGVYSHHTLDGEWITYPHHLILGWAYPISMPKGSKRACPRPRPGPPGPPAAGTPRRPAASARTSFGSRSRRS